MLKQRSGNVAKEGLSIGMGVTANCNLNCKHCYSRPLRGQNLTLDQVLKVAETKNINSINFGTGESSCHPEFSEMVDKCYEMGIKMSLTSNGYSIIRLPDEQLRKFNDLDISLDFIGRSKQNSFRNGESQELVDQAIEKSKRLGIEFSITAVLMNINYKEIPQLLEKVAEEGCNLRVNVFKPVPRAGIYKYRLSFEEFWGVVCLLFAHGNLISCTEPIVNAMLDIPSTVPKSPCGSNSIRIHPNGTVSPCVYLTDSHVHIDSIEGSFEAALESETFKRMATVPEFCETCEKLGTCGGGCASRRHLNGGLDKPDEYCPLYRQKRIPEIKVTKCRKVKDLVHSSYLCTMIFEGKKRDDKEI